MKNFIAGKYIQKIEYKSFLPEFVNRNFEITNQKIIYLLSKSMHLLGELDAYSRSIPNIDVFIYMLAAKEATLSSRIEGTQTTIDEAILPEEEITEEKKNDWQEVRNYIEALNFAGNELNELPLCMRLIKETHAVLLQKGRGEVKQPGEYRNSQNWIGPMGSTPSSAFFVPPPPEEVPNLLSDLEKFWHNADLEIPDLIKIAITHYQFETIHPFLDGNGRLGRLLIILQLLNYGILKKQTLYLSDYFEKNRKLYYDSLSLVREQDNLEQWIIFFLQGVCYTVEQTLKTLKSIDFLRNETEKKLKNLGKRSLKGFELLDLLFIDIFVSVEKVSKKLNLSFSSANILIKTFVELGILKETTKNKKNRKFVFLGYLNIFKENDVKFK